MRAAPFALPDRRLYLALWAPFLPAERRLRNWRLRGEDAPEAPFALVERASGGLRIAALDARAHALGLRPGARLTQARARAPDLRAFSFDGAGDESLARRLALRCGRFSPLTASDPPNGLMLDATGCAHLFGGEAGLRAAALADLRGLGFRFRAAFGPTPDCARALARFAPASCLAESAAPENIARALPLAALECAPETALALRRAGLRTLADLDARPAQTLAARFGPGLVDKLRRVLGRTDRRLTPLRPAPECAAEARFPEPLAQRAGLERALEDLAARLCAQLEARGLGARRVEIEFFRADGQRRALRIALAAPARTPQVLSRLIGLRLDSLADPLDPGYGYDSIALRALRTQALEAQAQRLDSTAASREPLAALADRLAARLGPDRVRAFVFADTHDPLRRAREAPFSQIIPQIIPSARRAVGRDEQPASEPPLRPLRLFDPPEPIEAMALAPDAPPAQFRWRRVLRRVARAEGPERLAPDWLRGRALTRDYYRIEDEEGRRYWAFREGLYESETAEPRWFLHGLFA